MSETVPCPRCQERRLRTCWLCQGPPSERTPYRLGLGGCWPPRRVSPTCRTAYLLEATGPDGPVPASRAGQLWRRFRPRRKRQ